MVPIADFSSTALKITTACGKDFSIYDSERVAVNKRWNALFVESYIKSIVSTSRKFYLALRNNDC